MIKYFRRTTSAAGNGLSTTINEQSPAMHNAATGDSLCITTKYLQRTTSAAAGNGLGTT